MKMLKLHLSALPLAFALACVGCDDHKTPVEEIVNHDASIPLSTLPMNPLGWRVVTSFANRKEHTMATLYGNDAAVNYARTHADAKYPDGAVLSLVTWQSKEDRHWFGGNIPGTPLRAEFVEVHGGSTPASYKRFEGKRLQPVETTPAVAAERINALIAEQAATMP
jgi:hypothetical protein